MRHFIECLGKVKKDDISPILPRHVVCNLLYSPDELSFTKKVSEYDQEIPQSQTADNPAATRGRVAQPSRDTRKTN